MAVGNDSDSYLCWDHWLVRNDETMSPLILAVLTAAPALLANIAVIVTVLCTETLRKQNFNMWVVSLAVADILFAITVTVTNTLTIYNYKFDYSATLFWMVYNGAVSYFTFIGLNLDRTFSIKKPLQSYGQTDCSFYKKISAVWVLALLPALPYLWDTSLALCERHCTGCWMPVDNKPLMWWHIMVGCLAPMLIIFAAWMIIFQELRKTTIAVKADSRRDKENRHVIVVMGIMTFAFIICTVPLTITLISSSIWRPLTSMWMTLSYTSCFFNSIINPILYLGISKQARGAFIALICCK